MFLLSKSIFTFQNLALVLQKFPSMHNRVLIISDHTAISLSMAFRYRDPDKAYKKKKKLEYNWLYTHISGGSPAFCSDVWVGERGNKMQRQTQASDIPLSVECQSD